MPSPKKVTTEEKSSTAELRHKAEEQWNRRRQKEQKTSMTEADLLRLLQELEVHQIELEIQQDELVRSHAELEVSLSQYSELYDFAPVGYFSLTQDGTIKRINLTGARLLGSERGKLINHRFAQFVANEDRLRFSNFLQKVFSTGQGQKSCEILLQADDSAAHWAQIEATLPDKGSECKLAVIDITDRKRAEVELNLLNTQLEQRVQDRTAELTRTNLELEHANHVKDEFLATMSHELRTPLISILGMSEMLLDEIQGSLNNRQHKSVQIIQASGQHLLELIKDILDLSKIGAGKFDYCPQMVNANALCKSSLAFVKEQALHKSIELVYEEEETNLFSVYVDLRRMKQVLINLLSNAVKFTPAGGKVTLQAHADEVRQLFQFSVIDTGIGIAQADLTRLFQPFVQVDSALNRQFDGTGLGLALVQKIIDIHGGSIEVKSEIGRGSRFTVNLPWDKKQQQPTIL